MKILVVCLAALLLFTQIAFGQDESLEIRQNKTIFIGTYPVGGYVPTLYGQPATVGIYQGGTLLTGIESGSGVVDIENENTNAATTFKTQGIYFRTFFLDTFNLLFGLHQHHWEAEAVILKSTATGASVQKERVEATLETKNLVGTVGIGNQWSWRWGMVIGIDWALHATLLNSTTTREIDVTTSTFNDIQDAQKELDIFEDYLRELSAFPGFLNLTVGLAF